MKTPINPFITSGYHSPAYFCDRELETENLINELVNGNNVALISTRRMGKTGLIKHVFQDERLKKEHLAFFIDIYATKSLREFIFALSKEIVERLKPLGRKAYEFFLAIAKSGVAEAITLAQFIQKNKLTSASSVQAAQRILLEKDYITTENENI